MYYTNTGCIRLGLSPSLVLSAVNKFNYTLQLKMYFVHTHIDSLFKIIESNQSEKRILTELTSFNCYCRTVTSNH